MANEADMIIKRSGELKAGWAKRNKKFKDWYNLLLLEDTLAQDQMESVVSNDPRTAFNLALHLLSASVIGHKFPIDALTPQEISATSDIEDYIAKRWSGIEQEYRQSGRQSWLRSLISLMLSTGWYSVFAVVDNSKMIAEIWHPAEFFPSYSDQLDEGVHVYTITPAALARKIRLMGWPKPRMEIKTSQTVMDYWTYDLDGYVTNGIVVGKEIMKPMQREELVRIPVLSSPVSGLPDRGNILTGNAWQDNYGESILASVEPLITNYNKMLTFIQQIVRDTANPRWLELSKGENGILRQADMFKRGAIFRGQPGDQVGPIQTPAMPVELQTIMFGYQNMMQRGLFPWVLYGNIQQQLTGVAMSQIASAALQVLTPYHQAIKGLLSDIDNLWLESIQNGQQVEGFKLPKDYPKATRMEVDYNIDIPGYLIQRATAARMLDPNFKLPTGTVMDLLFPEVKNPLKAQAQSRKDAAMNHPIAVQVDLIVAYREQARLLRENRDTTGAAELYEQAADNLQAQLAPQQAQQPQQGQSRVPAGQEVALPQEIMSREVPESETGGEVV
jgi:hypothetical protein